MVYADNHLNDPDWKVPFTEHAGASHKQLGAVISQNNKPIAFFQGNKASHIVTKLRHKRKFYR